VRVFVKEGDVGYGEERGSASLFDRIKNAGCMPVIELRFSTTQILGDLKLY
jgi:hypothetical protein